MTKKLLSIVIANLLLIILLSGCTGKTYTYQIKQEIDDIIKVELLRNEDATKLKDFEFTVLYTLNEDEVESFIERLAELNCYKYFNDPAGHYGSLVIRIYYDNGDTELIGISRTNYIKNGKSSGGSYFFGDEDMHSLFAEYIDPSML